MTCQPGNLSTNHLNATISGNDFSCPVMLLEDHGRYMRRFADCVFPSLFGLCRLAIYPAIAFTAQPQRTGNEDEIYREYWCSLLQERIVFYLVNATAVRGRDREMRSSR